MTQSFTLRESDSELAPEAVFTSPNMMPPWKQSDVAFNLDVLERPGQKRRRSFMQQDPFNVYSESHNMLNERVSTDSVQLSNLEPNPGGNNMFSGLDSSAFPSERRGFYSRVLESSSCGIFPFRAPEVVEHSANSSVFLGRNNADFFGARNQQRSLDSVTAMANFQALFDQGRSSSSSSGFQAYNGSNGTQTSTLPSTHRQTPSFSPLREQQQQQEEELHSNHGFSLNPSFGLPTTTSSGFNYFSGFQDTNSLAFGDPAATGVNGAYAANAETAWSNLTCNTSVPNPSQSTLFPDPPSPCTPRGHTVLLTDSQEEYLQHMERLNSEALHDSPPPRGRRLLYNPLPLPDERSSQGNNNYNIFHPFELDHHSGSQEKHLHVYFDESGIPRHVDVEDSAPTTVTQVDESAALSGTRGIALENFDSQEENYSLSFDPPQAAVAGGEKEISRSNADQFDLNEVPVSVGEATPPKPRKKYHPRVAKDKRTYKRRADGKKAPANAVDGFANTDSPAKKSAKKRGGHQATQYDSTTEEGRDSSYPEVVDMDIEDMTTAGVTAPHTAQHDTTVCDCEACIKLRLERRNSTAAGPDSRFASFDDTPQSPVSPWGHSPDSSSNSPSVRRTLFQASPAPEFDHASNGAPAARRLPIAFDDSSLEQANATVLSQANSTARRLPFAFDDSSLEQANATVLSQANSTARRLPLTFDDSSSEQANVVVLSQANSTTRRLPLAFDGSSSEQANAAQANSTVRRMPLAFDDSSPEHANAVALAQANSSARRLPLAFDDSSSEQANAAVLSLANSTARSLPLAFDDSSSEQANAMVLSQANSTAYANVRSFFNSSRASCLQQFNESATQLGFSWDGRQQQQQQQKGDAAKPANSFDWNPPFIQRAPSTTSSTFMSRLCPRGILSPQQIPFRDMTAIQRVVYLKSILSSNPQLKMSPESLLRHVHDHLPEDEKAEFQTSLWPIILKNLTEEQMKQLEDYAHTEQQQQQQQQQVGEAAPRAKEVAVAKRKPGPKPKKKELVMTLWPNLVESKANTNKPGKGRRTKKTAEDAPQKNHGLEMVPYETSNSNSNGDKAMVPYEQNKTLVAYEGPFNPMRKKKARPKVVLDGETVRVWKLLMGKTASAGAENVPDVENALKWEDERRKMKAQALLFIERMHIVQGDRSFSCWKGSVVDSVVGAFLTQNVNDVLSSSAFMSMRSRFPGRGFRRSPLQTKNPESFETVAASFESPPSPAPQTSEPSTQNIAPEFPPSSITVLESQESRNEEPGYDHLHIESATNNNTSWNQNHEESAASTLSEVINQLEDTNSLLPQSHLSASTLSEMINQPEDMNPALPQSHLSGSTLSELTNQPEDTNPLPPQCEHSKTSNSQSENSSGLEYQMVPEELSSGVNNNQVEIVVSSENEISRELSTEGSAALVEGSHEPSHGKYNPKTGLTGLERAKIEEKQVTARKSFDFSGLNEEFKPRIAGEERPPGPPRTEMTEDGVDWEAVRAANVQEVADVIKERGLNWILAGRIKAFLERIHLDYGALDLEWLRSMSTDQTKEFLLSIRGLGLKSVECIRLLTLHHLAFPVDTNVGRICVRLGWVPLEPLPEELQLHLLELYPVQATIQKYLWPRLCKLDQQTLYELHYQMITFGKVFCTKSKPNCNACPMRPECKHFASALSSAKLALPTSERPNNGPTLALPPGTEQDPPQERVPEPPRPVSQYCQPIVEEPMTPESKADLEEFDIEDYPFTVEEVEDDTDMNICIQDPLAPSSQLVQQSASIDNPNCSSILSITDSYVTLSEPEPVSEPVSEPVPTIMEDWGGLATSGNNSVHLGVNCDEESGCCSKSVIKIVESVCEEVLDLESNVNNNHPSEVLIHPNTALSHEMVLVPPGAASLPVPKLKNVGRLRTVHYVYELPDNHPLLDGLDPREHDDPCTYLLAIWSPGEVPESIPNMNDTSHEENPFAASSSDGEESIKATLLVPCRTAMHGSFPLNGTYFQVNEVFADHASSLQPMIVPRTLLWNLRRRFVFFGTSVTSIFRGMTVEEIQACFWRGYVCVRGFDRATRAPKPLVGRLHLQAGKSSGKGANAES